MKKFEYQTVSAEGHRFFGSGNNFSKLKYYRIRLFLFSYSLRLRFVHLLARLKLSTTGFREQVHRFY